MLLLLGDGELLKMSLMIITNAQREKIEWLRKLFTTNENFFNENLSKNNFFKWLGGN